MDPASISAVAATAGAIGTIGTLAANSFQIWRLQRRQRLDDETEQARLISAWLDPKGTGARLINRSSSPVHNVVVCQVFVQGAAPNDGRNVPSDHRISIQTLPPEPVVQMVSGLPGPQGMHTVPGIEFAFFDSDRRSWIRRSDGTLARLPKDVDPVRYYSLELPVDWTAASPIEGSSVAIAL